MLNDHARLSPSASKRWANCPGSVVITDKLVANGEYVDSPSDFAIEGTGRHVLLETAIKWWTCWVRPAGAVGTQALANKVNPGDLIGKGNQHKPEGWIVTQSMLESVSGALNCIIARDAELKEQYPDCQVVIKTEQKVYPGEMFGRTDFFGTADVLIEVYRGSFLVSLDVFDFKTGFEYVSAYNNNQLMSYAGGRIAAMDYECKIRLSIYQPTTEPEYRFHDVSYSDVKKHCQRLVDLAKLTDLSEPILALDPVGPQGWCNYCPVRSVGQCSKISEKLRSFDVKCIDDVNEMSPQQMVEFIRTRKFYEEVYEFAETRVKALLEKGEPLEGVKLVQGAERRVWKSEEMLLEAFKSDPNIALTVDQVKSPGKLIKEYPGYAEMLEQLIERRRSAPSLKFVASVQTEDPFASVAPPTAIELDASLFF